MSAEVFLNPFENFVGIVIMQNALDTWQNWISLVQVLLFDIKTDSTSPDQDMDKFHPHMTQHSAYSAEPARL